MQLNSRNAIFTVIVLIVMFSTCEVYGNTNLQQSSIKTEGGVSTFVLFVSFIIFTFILSRLLYRLLKERKFRKELVSFNDKFKHYNRDSSTLNRLEYQTKQLQRLASNTSQIIDTRDKAVEDLEGNKELLLYHDNLIEITSDAIISTNMKNIIKSWNSAASKIFGYRFEQVYGKKLSAILNFKYINSTRAIVYETLIKEKYWKGELHFQKSNGDKTYLHASLSLIRNKKTSHGFVGVYTDITKRKLAQKSYLESEKYFRTIFNNANIGNCVLNREGKFEKVNKYLLNLLEYSSQELREMSFNDVIYQEDLIRFEETFNRIIRNEVNSTRNEVRVTLHSARPGIVIGPRGGEVERLREELEQITSRKVNVNVVEIKHMARNIN